jgi:septal ring factor EnvC (AmiA/AmiB activator)
LPRHADRGEDETARIESAISSIDAKIKLLAQRLKIIEMNEQVIGRTLVSHNKKLKEMEGAGGTGDMAPLKQEMASSITEDVLAQVREEVKRSSASTPSVLSIEEASGLGSIYGTAASAELEEELKNLKKAVSSLKQEVEELKYVMGSFNPMEYVTVEELGDIISKKIEKELGAKKTA